jgi:peptide/nickel transport system permease protein
MTSFLLRRFVSSAVLVAIAASLAYLLAAAALNPRANYENRRPAPPKAVIDARLTELNLNDETPLLERYATWAKGVLHGDLGKTWDGDDVSEEIGRRVLVSLRLLLVATILGGILGIAAGAWSAVRSGRPADHAVTVASFTLLAVPPFVLAVLLEILAVRFNDLVGTSFFEYTGEFTPGQDGGVFADLTDRVQHLILPSLTLILAEVAIISRYQRSAMLDVLGADYVRTARAKGLTRNVALRRHALRTALIPSATFIAFNFGLLFVGSTFVEEIFGWHGMGELFIDSIVQSDVNSVAAVSAFVAILVLIAGLLSDVAYALLDPRVRVG